MATLPFPDDVRKKLREPNPCTITTLRPDGQPVSVATWYLLEDDDRILVNMDATRRRLEHVRGDPRVALTVLDRDSWYTHVSVVGRVVALTDDDGLREIDRLSDHYTGRPYPDRTSPRVSARIEVERWHGWGAARQS
jgi:PPOX class probable F420-dependent enzyme